MRKKCERERYITILSHGKRGKIDAKILACFTDEFFVNVYFIYQQILSTNFFVGVTKILKFVNNVNLPMDIFPSFISNFTNFVVWPDSRKYSWPTPPCIGHGRGSCFKFWMLYLSPMRGVDGGLYMLRGDMIPNGLF